jgi:hypothetical protein
MPSAAAGGLAGGDVGPGHGNKRHEVAIELTTVLLAVVARPGRAPATAHGGDRRRRTRRLGAWRCGGQIDANERARELACVLRKRAIGSNGGKREREALAPAAATMAAAMARAARCGAGGFFTIFPSKSAMPLYMKVVSLNKIYNFHKGRILSV